MSKEFDEVLLHYGVKGMKWDKEKRKIVEDEDQKVSNSKTVSKEYLQEVEYNSKKNSYGVKGMEWDKEKKKKENPYSGSRQRAKQKASLDAKARRARVINSLQIMKLSKLMDMKRNEAAVRKAKNVKEMAIGRLISRNVMKKAELERKYPSPINTTPSKKTTKQKIMDKLDMILTGGTSSVTKKKKKP